MPVRIELSHDEDEVAAILTCEYANRKERPELSAAQIRMALVEHYKQVSRSAIMMLTEKQIKNTEYWAKRVVKGKGFHFKPRNTNWYKQRGDECFTK